jgi:hypothetical protein
MLQTVAVETFNEIAVTVIRESLGHILKTNKTPRRTTVNVIAREVSVC